MEIEINDIDDIEVEVKIQGDTVVLGRDENNNIVGLHEIVEAYDNLKAAIKKYRV